MSNAVGSVDKCWVYWIHLPEHTDFLTEGYIGITNDVDRRFKEHQRVSPFVSDACELEVLVCGGRDYCLSLENKIRPYKYIGWNVTAGGHTEKLEHLSRRAEQFYSKNYNLEMSLREWSCYLDIDYEVLRRFARFNRNKAFDFVLQNAGKRKEYRVSHLGVTEEAMFYLENTAMRPTTICKKLGWQDSLQEMFKYDNLSNNILRNCKLPVYDGRFSIWIKRQQTIWDFDDLNTILDMGEAGAMLTEIAEETGYSTYTIKQALSEMLEMRHA